LTRGLKTAVRKAVRSSFVDKAIPYFSRGKAPSSFWARLAPTPGDYQAPTLRTVRRNGIRYELDLSDYMEWCLYFGVVIEPRAALYALISKGDIVIDVGANIGEVTLNAAALVGTTGKVYSFEPSRSTFRKLGRNVDLNKCANVTLFNMGLSSAEGSAAFMVPNGNRGGARIASPNEHPDQIVELTTLDQLWSSIKGPVSLIKVDIEGHEFHALKGAEWVLREYRPKLFVELDDANLRRSGSSAEQLLSFIETLGYRIVNAYDGKEIHPSDDMQGKHLDFIATNA
jgi:FkbM family methyltransferase